ncbi:MAG: hypothetical protein H7Y13_01010 [Sphingobacteriaceae bacterium]|nr:hypothetical protein [Sphingobacteriaceae bacterium]
MKTACFMFALLLLFISSCEKSKEDLGLQLNGEWVLISSNGGMMPASTPLPSIKLVINNSDYQVFNKEKLSQSSKFDIVEVNETIDNYKFTYKLDFENPQMLDEYVGFENNKLRMQSGSIAVDNVIQYYKRQ